MYTLSIVGVVAVVIGLGATCQPPTLHPEGKWVPNQGCSMGQVYQTLTAPQHRCQCWEHCGYVCEPSMGGSEGEDLDAGVKVKTTTEKTGSPCAFGGVWFNNKGQRCRCQSFNQQSYYVCEATTTPAGSGGNTTPTGSETTSASDGGGTTLAGETTTTG